MALKRLDGDTDLLREMLWYLVENYREAVAELARLAAAHQFNDAERLAHSLRSVAATLEAIELAEACAALEHAFRERNLAGFERMSGALETALRPALRAAASVALPLPSAASA